MPRYYIQNGNCGTETAFKSIGAKWKPRILNICESNTNISYNDLKTYLIGITDSILSKQIKELLDDGMIEIISSETKKNKKTLYITQKAKDVTPALLLMQDFADMCGYNTSGYNNKIEYTKKIIGNKWKSRIIWTIYNHETIRFNEILSSIEGLSHKILIQHLSSLIKYGLIEKTDYNEKNPHVEYSLTDNGKIAYQIIKLLADWCVKYELIKPRITITY